MITFSSQSMKNYILIYKFRVIFDSFLASLRSLGGIFNSAGVGNVYVHMLVKKKKNNLLQLEQPKRIFRYISLHPYRVLFSNMGITKKRVAP